MPQIACRFAVVLVLLTPCALAASGPQASSCYQLTLQGAPSWITSGATWDRENQRLLLVDPKRERVVSYNLSGEQETISDLSHLHPHKISRSDDGFLLELADGSMLSLDRNLAVTGPKNLAAKLSPTTMTSLYQWATPAPGRFAAFAAVAAAKPVKLNKVQYGFFYAQGDSKLQLLLPADELQGDFFLLGYPYITATADEIFFLSMAKHPALYRVRDGKAEKLDNALPPKYATRPDFKTPRMTGEPSAVARFAELETLSIPVGLYAQDGYLYLLTREPAAGGKTAWWLYQIDPAGPGNILGQVRLPTSASHLTVIPTPDRGWLLVERSKAELDSHKHQTQRVGPVVVVSNAAIQSLSVPASCPLGGGILWADSRALFVPEGLLASKMMLPVDHYSQNYLDLRLKRTGTKKVGSHQLAECDFLEPSPGQGKLPNAASLEGLVAKAPLAFTGRVVRMEPGWDDPMGKVVTKIDVEITRAIKGDLARGARISYLNPGGSMSVSGEKVCTYPRSNFHEPRIGDDLFILASSSSDQHVLELPYVFPVMQGMIKPEPYPALAVAQIPISLGEITGTAISVPNR